MNNDTRIELLSVIKKEIIKSQKDRSDLMVEYLLLRSKIMKLDQLIGKKQREMLSKIP